MIDALVHHAIRNRLAAFVLPILLGVAGWFVTLTFADGVDVMVARQQVMERPIGRGASPRHPASARPARHADRRSPSIHPGGPGADP
jgi:hypothetical protein